jgi:hypothetical protein
MCDISSPLLSLTTVEGGRGVVIYTIVFDQEMFFDLNYFRLEPYAM